MTLSLTTGYWVHVSQRSLSGSCGEAAVFLRCCTSPTSSISVIVVQLDSIMFWRVAALAAVLCAFAFADPLPDIGAPDFKCSDMTPSAAVPTSAHAVKPADIKVVAALGDSLTAGNGAGSPHTDPVAVLLQYRGLAFQGGGDKGLAEHVTIPNILRAFNPSVFGYALGVSTSVVWSKAHLNLGFPGAESKDIIQQARDLVSLMNKHTEVINVTTDWKLVNIFIGANDICVYCEEVSTHQASNYQDNIRQTVRILQEGLPRTIVSITGMFNMRMLRNIDHDKYFCEALHTFECDCESDTAFTNAEISDVCISYMKAQEELVASGEFDTKDDFTLVLQPFFNDVLTPPLTANGTVNMDFFAADCFHFSQFGHAAVSKFLWNNVMQPVGGKDTSANLSDYTIGLSCPDPMCPFIRTTKNSQNCSKYFEATKLPEAKA